MIAIAIMAVLSLMAWRGLDSMSRTQTRLAARADETTQLMHALQQFERDVAWRATVELPTAQGRSTATSPTLAWLPPGMTVQRGGPTPFVIELVRAAPAEPGKWQRLQWWLRAGRLYRAAGSPAATFPLPSPTPGDAVVVLDGVEDFEVRAWDAARGWQQLPAAGTRRAPSSGLEITLRVMRGNGPAMNYRQVIALGTSA